MLEIIDLTKKYKSLTAVDALNLTIADGEFFGLLGPNGAGKTTTVRMISTLTPKTSGDIVIGGESIDRNLISIKAKIGVVPQQNNLENEMSAWENLEVHGMLYKMPKEKRRQKLLKCLRLRNSQNEKMISPRIFPGGMKRKLMIARALLHEPELCF
jgi:ABC-type multidrug transport system, ATPase component